MLNLPRANRIRPVSWRRVAIFSTSPLIFPNIIGSTYSTVSAAKLDDHPVNIDARLHNQRYRIVHLLGHSKYSAVWLGRDDLTSRYVAVKVCAPNSDSAKRESEILSRLSTAATTTEHEGRPAVQTFLDRFTISGPKGDHICLVSQPARGSLLKAIRSDYPTLRLPLNVARSLAAQLALAVSFMHSQGIAHGDVRINNALVQFSPPSSHINNLSVPQLYAKYSAPVPGSDDGVDEWERKSQEHIIGHKRPPSRPPPPHGIGAIALSIPADQLTLSQARLVLTDFRSSFDQRNELRYQSHGPLSLQPPDMFLPPYPPLNFDSDIWSLGAAISELLGSVPLIDKENSYFILSDEDTTRLYDEKGRDPTEEEYDEAQRQLEEEGLGRTDANGRRLIPTDWWNCSGYMERLGWHLYQVDCDWRYDSGLSEFDTLESYLQYIWEGRKESGEEIGEEEMEMVLEMLRKMLAFRGGMRPSAEQVLELDWMRRYAMPAYEEAKKAWD